MPTSAIAAYGVTLTRAGNAIAEITNIGGVEVSRDMIDVSSHGSPDNYKEKIPGLKDTGEITLEGNFKASDASGQVALLTDFEAGTLQTFVLTFPTAITATWTITGFVTKFKTGDFAVDGKLPFTAAITPTGKPVFANTATNNVSALTITTATLYPTFAAATYIYTATSVGASVTVTATFAAGTATATNGTSTIALTSTVESAALALGVAGTVTTITIVVTETGKVPKTYVLSVAKTA